ncbi:sporulation membrane protein YtaF [Anoxybacter fermentans]|uniref:Sporulation membrane protein YtaF n=1 Tax=Anoxybacter fermentans TaxID=1323375 RepID=A0A3Q9HQU7_9FIRM|nr:sporulation membrane protein YtaF [Anoxybacter fermentans]AZR73720.1 sporulation membrane protein YtaF [Anoxybacter fermentans]
MDLLYIVFLAIAISLDGFFVGITYGFRKIKVSFIPLLIISATSSLIIMVAMVIGCSILDFISPGLAEMIGAVILIGVGVMVIYETYKSLLVQKEVNEGYSIMYVDETKDEEPHQLFTWKIKPLGIIINILREPTEADFDASGSISNYEAIFLGLALALDALGAGFGAALTGFNPILIPLCVGLTKFVFLYSGNFFGARFSNLFNNRLVYLSGVILILLGVMKLF